MCRLIGEDILRVARSLELRVALALEGNGDKAIHQLVELNTRSLPQVER